MDARDFHPCCVRIAKVKPRIGITYSNEIKVASYAEAIRASGGEPIPIEPGNLAALELDGFVLSGGVDVNPALYNERRAAETEEPNDARDQTEIAVLRQALESKVPVLAICRGMQMLNVFYGGNLHQHITGHEIRTVDKALPAHEVRIREGSRLATVLGAEVVAVNSRHHQAVGRVADALQVTATSADGVVEAMEDPAHDFVLGVQWHPEDMAAHNATQKRLFDELVKRAQR